MLKNVNSGPKRVFIMCASTNDWLYPPVMESLRARFATTFRIVAAFDRVAEFLQHCAEGDTVVSARDFVPRRVGKDELDPAAVFERARELEDAYRVSYFRDIIQQDRSISTGFLGIARNSIFGDSSSIDEVELVNEINQYFEFFERYLEDEAIDLIIDRPGGLSATVMATVAEARGIPMTFFHGSYYGGGAQWAAGPYMGDLVTRQIFAETPEQSPVPDDVLHPSATWTKPLPPRYSELAIRLIKMLVIRAEFMVENIRTRSWPKRVPFWTSLIAELRQFGVRRFLHDAGEADLKKIKARPFVYLAMPFEPEYTIQSLCREFADTTAWLRQLALALPSGYRLVVKEHQRVGNRTRDYYEQLSRIPNVVIADPGLRGVDLIASCAATATMGGSTPAEAALMGKPSIVFGPRNPYSFLPSVAVVLSPADLVDALRIALKPMPPEKIDTLKRAGARFRKTILDLSFEAKGTKLFLGGKATEIDPAAVEKAVDTLLLSMSAQLVNFGGRESSAARSAVS